MSLRIRLARGGAKKRPFYRIVVAEATAPRDGRFVEKLGTYNPMLPKDHEHRITVKQERIRHWLSVGARPSDRVHRMLGQIGMMEAFAWNEQPKKSAPGRKRTEREAEEAGKPGEAAASEDAPAEAAAAEQTTAEAEEAATEEAPAEEAATEEAPAEEAEAEEESKAGG